MFVPVFVISSSSIDSRFEDDIFSRPFETIRPENRPAAVKPGNPLKPFISIPCIPSCRAVQRGALNGLPAVVRRCNAPYPRRAQLPDWEVLVIFWQRHAAGDVLLPRTDATPKRDTTHAADADISFPMPTPRRRRHQMPHFHLSPI
jgi:hypothetical protein